MHRARFRMPIQSRDGSTSFGFNFGAAPGVGENISSLHLRPEGLQLFGPRLSYAAHKLWIQRTSLEKPNAPDRREELPVSSHEGATVA